MRGSIENADGSLAPFAVLPPRAWPELQDQFGGQSAIQNQDFERVV